jgi:hypothetical protein
LRRNDLLCKRAASCCLDQASTFGPCRHSYGSGRRTNSYSYMRPVIVPASAASKAGPIAVSSRLPILVSLLTRLQVDELARQRRVYDRPPCRASSISDSAYPRLDQETGPLAKFIRRSIEAHPTKTSRLNVNLSNQAVRVSCFCKITRNCHIVCLVEAFEAAEPTSHGRIYSPSLPSLNSSSE